MKKSGIILLLSVTIIVLLIAYRFFVPGNGVEKQLKSLEKAKLEAHEGDADIMRIAAYNTAVQYVSKNLKSPATAKFSKSWEDGTVITNIDSLYTVQLQVDAQNTFGALIRNTFTVTMIFNRQTGFWTIKSSE